MLGKLVFVAVGLFFLFFVLNVAGVVEIPAGLTEAIEQAQ